MRKLYLLLTLVCIMLTTGETRAQQLAFPGADGYGKYTTGGRGGEVCYVTRTDDCSDTDLVPGTLRWALRHDNGGKPRTVLFNVSGTIYLTSVLKLQYGDVSILGQSAPGGGVCIAGYNLYICKDNVIVRYVRFRAGDIPTKSMTGLDMENCQNVIIDHCSMTWSMEECLTAYDSKNTTVQWCIIGEGLYSSKNAKGARAYATQWGGERSTMHHTLITNSHSRSPRFNGVRSAGTGHDKNVDSEFANNVVFNWSISGAQYGGENYKACNGYDRVYMINNFYRPGPSTKRNTANARYFAAPSVESSTGQYGEWYLTGNKFEVDGTFSPKTGVWSSANLALVNDNNYYGAVEGNSNRAINLTGTNASKYLLSGVPYALSGLEYESAEAAFAKVTTKAGASLPRYDEVDRRLLDEAAGVRDPQFVGATLPNDYGIIDSPDDITLNEHDTYIVDGVTYTNYPFLGMREGDKYMVDSDADGLPDVYEDEIGLNPLDPADAANITDTGYTYLENYLNGIASGTIQKNQYETSDFVVEPGQATRPETVTYAFACTDSSVEGSVPTGATVAYGAEITIPQNTSLYKEGYTLTSWTANSRIYEPGKTYNVSADMTLTPVFSQNRLNLDDRSKETTVTWDFTIDGAPAVSATGGNGIYVNQVSVDDYVIDARVSYNATSVTIPWCEGASVKINNTEATATDDGDKATVDVAEYLPLQSIAVTLPYVKKITTDTYHPAAVTDLQNYELVMMPENQEELDAIDWMEVKGGDPRFVSRWGLDPTVDDGTTGTALTGPVINATTRVLTLYVTKTDKIRAWAVGSSSPPGDKVTMTATPDDGSGSTSVTTVKNLTKSGDSEVIELALDPEKRYMVTFTSVDNLDMMIPAVKLYYGEEATITGGEGTVKWTFTGKLDKEGTQTPVGVFETATATVGSALTVINDKKTQNELFVGFQPEEQISSPNKEHAVSFNLVPTGGVFFQPKTITFDAARFGTDGGKVDVSVQQGNGQEITVLRDLYPNRDNDPSYSKVSIDLTDYDNISYTDEPLTIRMYIYNLGNTKQVGFKNIVVSGEWNGSKPEVKQYTFTASVSPAEAATVAWTPKQDIYDEKTNIDLVLTPKGNYLFENWTNQNGEIVSTKENFTYTIKANTELTANYKSYDDYGYIFENVAPYDAAVKTINELKVALSKASQRTDKTTRYRIFLHNGIYDYGTSAKNSVPGNVSLIGESQDGVIITNKPVATNNWADNTPTLFIDQTESDVYMQDLTVRQGRDWESQTSTGQAMAIRQRGKHAVYKNVTLQGIQDTYYLNKGDATAYFETSTIAGQTDYIYGDGTMWFEKCNLYNTGAGYIVAPNTPVGASYWGIVLNECEVDGTSAAAGKFYLGRPWNDSPHATYINTTFKQQPMETGWGAMTANLVIRFHEYGSKDANGNTLDLSNRSLAACSPAAGSDKPVLTDVEAAKYTLENVFGDWNPQTLTAQLTAPTLQQDAPNSSVISWQPVPDAIGYAIVRNGNVVAFTTNTTYDVYEIGAGEYSIRVANNCGGLGEPSSTVTGISGIKVDNAVKNAPKYSLSGQRVNDSYKGIVIQNGKKYIAK
ncbi:MAG: hypothetical protein J1E57_08285 [Prevotella sp.]|nr:hypothetical protein [Prevotella sp.]